MITADNLASLIGSLAWPFAVLVLVCIFKNDISDLLKRMHKARFPGGEAIFVYGEAPIDKDPVEPSPGPKAISVAQPEQPKNTIKWSNTGNLFWAAHDLMWTIDLLLRAAPGDRIVHTLGQSLHQVRSLGFGSTAIGSRLAKLKDNAESSREQDWTALRRQNYTREVASLIWDIGQQAAAQQPDYEPKPKG